MNQDVFMPLGLYCMVLMCKDGTGTAENPEFAVGDVNLDTAKQISSWGLPKQNEDDHANLTTSKKIFRPIRLVSGKTKVSEMPLEIAPLIYPGLDEMASRPLIKRDESFKERMVRHKEFYADYFDRRARAEYAGNNPDSALTKASTQPKFHTRFGDPNHPVNQGRIIALVSGGKIVPKDRGRGPTLRQVGEDGKLMPKVKRKDPRILGPIGLVSKGVRKVLSTNILYLTVVNLPSAEELEEASASLGLEQKGIKERLQEMAASRWARPNDGLGSDRGMSPGKGDGFDRRARPNDGGRSDGWGMRGQESGIDRFARPNREEHLDRFARPNQGERWDSFARPSRG
jgi:hypothetical protein